MFQYTYITEVELKTKFYRFTIYVFFKCNDFLIFITYFVGVFDRKGKLTININ